MSDVTSDGVGQRPPGPALCAELARRDPHDVADEQLLELLSAHDRQLSYQQAQKWAVLAELARRDPTVDAPGGPRWSRDEIFESAVDEVRAELVLTRRSAEGELANAAGVAELPRVLAALSAGSIDRIRAIKFAEGCIDLTAEQTEVLLDELLPRAARVTATELQERIKRVAIALDPDWARRRYHEAVREQRVIGYLNPDGSATVSGQNLPADDAAAACARVDALADAAKRAGAAAKIDLLRATLFLGLLDGRFHGMPEGTIITELLRQFRKPGAPGAASCADRTAEPASDRPVGVGRGVHLRVGLATLLELDEAPAEIAGLGTVPALVARSIATRQRRSEWRYAIVDEDGRLLFDGITRRRPRNPAGTSKVSGGIVELHVPLALLDPVIASAHPGWANLLADLAEQFAEPAPIKQDPAARFAGRPLRRRQQTLFQRCIFPGCRRPATDCDLDHHREHVRGGRTEDTNLGPGCRHDHQLKTSRGWRLIRRDAQTYVWISPLGRKHLVTIGPVAPTLPAPIPRAHPPRRDPDDAALEPGPTFQPLDRRGRPLPSAAPAASELVVASDPDPPPF